MPKIEIIDVPDDNGAFVVGGDMPVYNLRALAKWMKDNDIHLEPGERLDPEIEKRFIVEEGK